MLATIQHMIHMMLLFNYCAPVPALVRFSAPVKKHWLGSFSIVLPPFGLRGFVPAVRDCWECPGPGTGGGGGGWGPGTREHVCIHVCAHEHLSDKATSMVDYRIQHAQLVVCKRWFRAQRARARGKALAQSFVDCLWRLHRPWI